MTVDNYFAESKDIIKKKGFTTSNNFLQFRKRVRQSQEDGWSPNFFFKLFFSFGKDRLSNHQYHSINSTGDQEMIRQHSQILFHFWVVLCWSLRWTQWSMMVWFLTSDTVKIKDLKVICWLRYCFMREILGHEWHSKTKARC